MLKQHELQIASIHVPVKRMKTLDREKVDQIALSILEEGQKTHPFAVRGADAQASSPELRIIRAEKPPPMRASRAQSSRRAVAAGYRTICL